MLTVGTRGSQLATTQAGTIAQAIPDGQLHIVTTKGDVNLSPVERIGVGVFTQELREVLARGEVDLIVHSFKDLPTAPDPRFHLIVPRRADNREALVARDGLTLAELPAGAKVGTSAPRRVAQVKALRPDLELCPLRGNVDSRLRKVATGELDAVILAYAGLSRLGLGDRVTELFACDRFLPAPAQGALAVECRKSDTATVEILNGLLDKQAYAAAIAERSLLAFLEAGCTAPLAAYAEVEGTHPGAAEDAQPSETGTDSGVVKEETPTLSLTGAVFAVDGSRQLTQTCSGTDPVELGRHLGAELLAAGAAQLLESEASQLG